MCLWLVVVEVVVMMVQGVEVRVVSFSSQPKP
jgi:hypothetical protein